MDATTIADIDERSLEDLREHLLAWGHEEGFQQIGITGIDLGAQAPHVRAWLERGLHGEMDWMNNHLDLRLDPATLLPGTCRVISARMNYLPAHDTPLEVLDDDSRGYVARYALGRDYHKVVRRRLARIARRLDEAARCTDHRYRAFTDSAPVLEKALAAGAGLGWMGRHSLLIHPRAGSFFFIGEVFTNLPLRVDEAEVADGCGACRACMKVCPTGAIISDRVVDARRCISYLTIEHDGPIDPELRPLMGNRIFGCDDCQLYCPWNRDAAVTDLPDFQPRHGLDGADLIALFEWSEAEFLERTQGSPIRRISHAMWRRNLAIALGNGSPRPDAIAALERALADPDPLVRDHVAWALTRLGRAETTGRDRT
jgi:epoxyqueuosine reductase